MDHLTIGSIIILIGLIIIIKGKNNNKNKKNKIILPAIPTSIKHVQYQYKNLPNNVLVTGGGGFLGSHIVKMLAVQGVNVTIFDLREGYAKELCDQYSNVQFIQGNLCNENDIKNAIVNQEAVIHVASPHADCKNKALMENVNINGTKNIINISKESGIEKFIFTSSASIIYEGNNQKNLDETHPIPKKFRDFYCETKAKAEEIVLIANDPSNNFYTVSIRPHGIFGQGDVQFFPTLIDNARKGKTKYIIGNGKNVVDFTYAGNVAHGHLLALEKAHENNVNGEAFFITNNEPIEFWTFLGDILEKLGYDRPYIKLPYSFLLYITLFIEKIFGDIIKGFTSSRIKLAGTYHYYSCKKAIKYLDYQPLWTLDDALNISVESFVPRLINPNTDYEKELKLLSYKPTMDEVALHNEKLDAWILVDGNIYDVTNYIDFHKGGEEALLNAAGRDVSIGFHGPQHPDTVPNLVKEFYIGELSQD